MEQSPLVLDAGQIAFLEGLASRTEAGQLRWYKSLRREHVLVARSGNAQCFVGNRDSDGAPMVRVVAGTQADRYAAFHPVVTRLHEAAWNQVSRTGRDLGGAFGDLGR